MLVYINPRSIVVYKIVREYEKTGKTICTYEELKKFVYDVLKIAEKIDNVGYRFFECPDADEVIKESLLKFCDLTQSACELNIFKYQYGGKDYAEKCIGAMSYGCLKGAIKVLEDSEMSKE